MICIDCKQDNIINLGNKQDFTYFRCPDCGIIYTSPFYLYDYINQYKKDYYKTYAKMKNNTTDTKGRMDRWNRDLEISEERIKRVLSSIGEYKHLFWLDIGGYAGSMIRASKKFDNLYMYVIEKNKLIVRWSRRYILKDNERYQLHEYEDFLHDVEINTIPFNIISCYDVFEHFHDPVQEIVNISRELKSGGLFIVEQPDPLSIEAISQGINWKHIKPFEHLYLFSYKNFEKLFNRVNMKLVGYTRHMPGRMFIVGRKI